MTPEALKQKLEAAGCFMTGAGVVAVDVPRLVLAYLDLLRDHEALALTTPSKAPHTEEACPGHVASDHDPKVCRHCGTHIDSLRPDDD